MPFRFCRARVLSLLLAGSTAVWLAGCASEPTQTAAPAGVNLTGEWALNTNLSDDPERPADTDKGPALSPDSGRHRSSRPGAGGGGMGIPPMGGPDEGPRFTADPGAGIAERLVQDATRGGELQSAGAREDVLSSAWAGTPTTGVLASGLEPATVVAQASAPATASAEAATATPAAASQPLTRKAAVTHLLDAPTHLSIVQNGSGITVRSARADGTSISEQFTTGAPQRIQLGPAETAERRSIWRGPVFVVTTRGHKSGFHEEDYALDDEGHLIVSIQTHGGRVGKFDFKRVYDRAKS